VLKFREKWGFQMVSPKSSRGRLMSAEKSSPTDTRDVFSKIDRILHCVQLASLEVERLRLRRLQETGSNMWQKECDPSEANSDLCVTSHDVIRLLVTELHLFIMSTAPFVKEKCRNELNCKVHRQRQRI
jgi:hypothetical protein